MKKPVKKDVAKVSNRSTTTRKRSVKRAGREPAADAGSPVPDGSPTKNILTAGIKALSHAHEEAVARQSRVFESLLGLGSTRDAQPAEKIGSPLAAALDPFGFKKFEDVFDQRVERAMQRLGVPDARTLSDLSAELERLRARIAVLESSGGKR